jgi:hypothetical protein
MDIFKNCIPVSLGNKCHIKNFLNLYVDQPTNIFDWVGSPQWGINKLINDNYDLFNPEDYGPVKIFNSKPLVLYSNKKYFFRFIHDLQPDTIINKISVIQNKYGGFTKIDRFAIFKDKYQRRIDRFIELLNSTNYVVFLRVEEYMTDKLMHKEHMESYAIPELEHVKEFINIIKNKYPTLKFKLIYFSTIEKTNISDNLLIINDHLDISDGDTTTCMTKLDTIVKKNLTLINDFINK